MCYENTIQPLPNGGPMIIYGYQSGQNLKIISCIKDRMYLHKKYYAYLSNVVDKNSKTKEIKKHALGM